MDKKFPTEHFDNILRGYVDDNYHAIAMEAVQADIALAVESARTVPDDVLRILRINVAVRTCGSTPCLQCENNDVIRKWLDSLTVAPKEEPCSK
jgi:hypothetical protein